jgi:transposase
MPALAAPTTDLRFAERSPQPSVEIRLAAAETRNAELELENSKLRRELEAAIRRLSKLEARNAKLRAELKDERKDRRAAEAKLSRAESRVESDSRNSSLPPSSDRPKTKAERAKERASKREAEQAEAQAAGRTLRKRGGQPGHRGHSRPLLPPEKVDRINDLFPTCCGDCKGADFEALPGSAPTIHQTTDLVPKLTETTEHRLHQAQCKACGKVCRASLPPGQSQSPFGPGLAALAATLTLGGPRCSKASAVEFFKTVLNVELCAASVVELEQRVSASLAPIYTEALEQAQEEAKKHKSLDETGWSQKNSKAWLWVMITSSMTILMIADQRAREVAIKLMGSLCKGILTSDRFSAYRHWCALKWQNCWSHLKRDFAKFLTYDDASKELGKKLLALERRVFDLWHEHKSGELSRLGLKRKLQPVKRELKKLLKKGTKLSHKKAASLSRGLLRDFESFWTFTRYDGVEPTNNNAERALRHGVIYRKTSFGTQSERGSRYVERMLTVRATLKQQGRPLFQFLKEALLAKNGIGDRPSLVQKTSPETLNNAA